LLALVKGIHARGYVHLDTGNRGNVLVSAEGKPRLIDFASALQTRYFPSLVVRRLQGADLMGVLKLWHRTAPETMPAHLQRFFQARYRKHIYSPKRLLNNIQRRAGIKGPGECGTWLVLLLGAGLLASLACFTLL